MPPVAQLDNQQNNQQLRTKMSISVANKWQNRDTSAGRIGSQCWRTRVRAALRPANTVSAPLSRYKQTMGPPSEFRGGVSGAPPYQADPQMAFSAVSVRPDHTADPEGYLQGSIYSSLTFLEVSATFEKCLFS
ncbi:hypothetical protein AAFF_G00186400 [Aldrovandia affinis]|uniref:Uncharacterized protein n=1 Tax=Aldrovandia affinis TaxID=143900 RepID=A0AAD7WVN8_9TELE|nr:hypothetical protein AAFF_G00186400 [Aldrovandia affinis]